MIGGDDFTTINEEIATLNDTVVFKAGTQTITGDKTITGVLAVDNADTTIVGTTVSINSDGLALNSFSGTAKYQHNATQSTIQNNNVFIADVAGTSGIIVSSGSVALDAPTAGSITQDIGANTKSLITNTATTLTNTTTNIVSGANTKASISGTTTTLTNDTTNIVSGTNKVAITSADTTLTNDTTNIVSGVNNKVAISSTDTTLTNNTTNIVSGVDNKVAISSTATTLDNTTTNIRSGGTNKITTNATTTTLNNTGGTTLQIASDPKISLLSASTTLNNTATSINSGGQLRFTQNATETQIRNATIQLQAAALDVKYEQTASQTDITNTTVNITGDTGGLNLSTANNGVVRVESVGAAGLLTLKSFDIKMRDDFDELHYDQDEISTEIINTTIRLSDSSSVRRYTQTNASTTMRNATISLQDNTPTTRFTQTNGTTTLTNTSINAVGNFYADDYFVGRSSSTNYRLASFQLPLGTCLIPNATGAGTTTTTGAWSPTGTSTQIRTPNWGRFYPLYAMIGLDGGSFTNTLTTTLSVQIREETNNYTLATTPFTITSGTSNASSGGTQAFTVFSGNEYITDGVLIRFQIVVVRQATISASTKSVYATVYGYQTV